MKTIENVTLYVCDHCKKEYKRKHAAIAHEPKCRKNPNNYQPCLNGCIHLENEVMKFMVDGDYGEQKNTTNAFWCNKKNHWVYPYWCNNPIIEEAIDGEIENSLMPNKCDDYSVDRNDILF